MTGPPFFTAPAGQPIGWKQTSLTYFTDPGDLSSSVPNAAANALVAAAAATWNVPVANITLSSGGSLTEHVSSQNTYLGPNGVVFPSDVMASNSSAIPVAIIYDTDGSVTDTLLGVGASQPSSCRQNAVTESVDGFDPAGYITHAIIILNGLCATATASSAQLEMQYKLERIFGRVLGLAWSQTNDNVFTGTPTPTYNQALNWPIMHPIDILCGPYAYQCLPNPFQLRPDDISGLVTLYPVSTSNTSAGKQPSLTAALGAEGTVTFPTGEGMAGVNVLIRRAAANEPADTWFENSAVTGATFRRAARSPFVAADTTALGSLGSTDMSLAGFYSVAYIPVETVGDTPWQNLYFSTEAVNPLYSGTYSLGPYTLGTVNPSGSTPQPVGTFVDSPGGEQSQDFAIRDAASTCGSGQDGTASAPVEVAATGWWTGLLCGYGHASYGTVNVHPNRTFTVEVTALDEQGAATETKAMPVIGLFAPTDAPGALPSLGVTPAAFNALTVATTSIHGQTGQLNTFSFGIADERGDGRPDFNYQARLFYADTVSPSTIATSGATLTLSGFGFRSGNTVTVNGVTAAVTSYTANTIVLTAPTMSSAHATDGTPVSITVTDLGTQASTTLSGALTYHAGALPNSMRIVSAPVGSGYVGDAMTTPFAVQVVAADGVTPVTGDSITFSATSGSSGFGSCSSGNSPCTVLTDSTGRAATKVTPLQAGPVTLLASDATLSQSTTFSATAQAGSILVFAAPSGNLPVNVMAQPYFFVRVFNAQGNLIPGAAVTFSAPVGSVTFSGCFTSTCTVTADSSATAFIFVTPTAPGPVTLQAASGDRHQQVSFTAVANTDTLQIHALPKTTAFINESAGQFQVQLLHGDGSADSLESVTFTASAGTTIDQCGSSSCSLATDGSGLATISLTSHQLGVAMVQANYGTLAQSASFTVIQHTLQLNVLSAPSGSFPVGVTIPTPFTTQLLQDGTPVAGVQMVLAVPPDAAVLTACNGGSCVLTTDGNGTVSTLVTPIVAGTITLSGAYPSVSTTASFVSIGQPETMRVVNQPAATGENVGDIEMFTVQLVGPDGSTPLAWHDITYTVMSGPFTFISCRYATCTGVTDATGLVNVWGIVTDPGLVSVQAAADGLTQTMTFTSSAAPDIMHLLTAPASGSYALSPAAIPFAVQLFFGDGVSFAANKAVTLSVDNGSATFGACSGASTCTVQTDATGTVSTSITPLAAGSITVSLTEAGATSPASQSATFSALPAPDQFQLISVPGSGSLVGVPAGTPFAAQLLVGGNPAPNRSVSLSLSSGSALFAACGGTSSCSVQTDASGRVSTQVTPLATGSITIVASELGATPAISQTATFTASVPSDVLYLTGVPSSGGLPGVTASAPFALQLFQSDAVTPIAGRSILLSVTGGSAVLGACGGGTSCPVQTDASGRVSTLVTPMASGTVSLVATEVGATPAVSQSATFTVSALPDTMRLLSAPASGGYPGSAESMPFSVQVLLGSGAGAVNKSVTLSVLSGSASFAACSGAATCTVQADATGTVTTLVTPLTSGSITLLAIEMGGSSPATQRATFTVAALANVFHLISAPATNSLIGTPASTPFAVQLLLADGVTPVQDRSVTLSITSGSAAFTACAGGESCTVRTDAYGVVSTVVTPLASGTITLLTTEPGASIPARQSATFVAIPASNILRVVSAPASGAYSGIPAGTAFALQVLLADGSTPVPNQNVTIAVTSGSASLLACAGTSTCTLRTDSLGDVSTTVTPLTAGTITLNGSIPSTFPMIMQSVSFTARQPQDVLAVTSTPGATVYLGSSSNSPLMFRLTQADGVTPVAGSSIALSSSGAGAVSFAACDAASCTLTTGMDGTVSTLVQGMAVGNVTLTATPALATGAQTATLTFQVLANQFSVAATPGQTWIAAGATVSLTLNATATLNGNAAASEVLQWSGTAGLTPAMASSVTGATGTSSMSASAGPLAAGVSSTATVCGRASVCQSFTATGVSSQNLAVQIVSGGAQSAQGGASLLPVTILVTDSSGHAVASAPLTVSQTVTALNQACPTHGRCPAAPVLNSQINTIVSSLDGTLTIIPLTVTGVPTQTEIAISSGTQGFATAVVSSNP